MNTCNHCGRDLAEYPEGCPSDDCPGNPALGMKTINVSEAGPKALDWLVAKCEGHLEPEVYLGKRIPRVVVCNQTICDEWVVRFNPTPQVYYSPLYNPSTSWDIGGQIIDRELISTCWEGATWVATLFDKHCDGGWYGHCYGPTPLIAAMRCYVTSKLGNVVEVPGVLA